MIRNPEQQREIDALRAALQFTRKLNARLVRQNQALRRRLGITKPTPAAGMSTGSKPRSPAHDPRPVQDTQGKAAQSIRRATAAGSAPMIARKKADWFTGGRVSPKSLANEDKLGTGPSRRAIIGGEVCYPREAFVEYLLSKNVEVIDVPVL